MSSDSVYHSPLTPVELLVALHNIDPAKCDIKTTIKGMKYTLLGMIWGFRGEERRERTNQWYACLLIQKDCFFKFFLHGTHLTLISCWAHLTSPLFVSASAANLCFSERNIYTQEVLAIVMQQLMDQDPLPTLLMRTVIQSLSMYPRLIGFVLNILQRLIVKKVTSSMFC